MVSFYQEHSHGKIGKVDDILANGKSVQQRLESCQKTYGCQPEVTTIKKDKGALVKLTFGDKQVVTMTTEMTEANFSGKLKSYEAQIVAAFLPKCT
jgi:hypothetical protein